MYKKFKIICISTLLCFLLVSCSVVDTEEIKEIITTEIDLSIVNDDAEEEIDELVLYGPYTIDYVVDGDTIRVFIDDESIYIRFIGIDTPESVHPDEEKNTDEGSVSSDYLKEILDDSQAVYLEYDEELTDYYGRTLAYVYLEDMETMLQEVLLSDGYAITYTFEPNTKYADLFLEYEEYAANNNLGLWGTEYFS